MLVTIRNKTFKINVEVAENYFFYKILNASQKFKMATSFNFESV